MTRSEAPSQMDRRVYLGMLVIILLLAAGLRLYALEADAPLDLSPTQELNLDGPVTIAAGRDRAVFGSWDPYPGPLQPYRLYPAMNWYAYLVFELIGVGYWQANLISVLTGFLSIVFLSAFAREQFGRRVSLFSALFLSINYVYIIYNRDPMAYTTASCGVTLSLFCWGKGLRRPAWFFISGAVTVFNALFIKLPGMAFLPAAFLGFAALWWPNRKQRRFGVYAPAIAFVVGAMVTALAWLFLLYLPNSNVVSKAYYVRTFSPSYSILDNVRFAIQSILFFGVEYGFHLRMLPLFTLSYAYFLVRIGQLLGKRRTFLSPAELVSLTLLASSIFMLFFSGIRPLRFQIMLIPPMSLIAALALDTLVRNARLRLPEQFGRLYPILIQVFLTYFTYQILAAVVMAFRIVRSGVGPVDAKVALPVGTLYTLLVCGLIVGILGTMFFLWRVVRLRRFNLAMPSRKTGRLIAASAIVLTILGNLYQYWLWAREPQYSIVNASQGVGRDYDPETTILGGTYAYTLALENDLPAVWFFSATPPEDRVAAGITHFARSYEAADVVELELVESDELCASTHLIRGYTVKICQTR